MYKFLAQQKKVTERGLGTFKKTDKIFVVNIKTAPKQNKLMLLISKLIGFNL